VDRVAVVPDHECGLAHLGALPAGRRHAAVEEALEDRRRGLRVLAYPVEQHVAEQPGPSGHAPSGGSERAGHGGAEREPDEQRGERDGAAEQGVVQHRHLDQHPPDAVGPGGGRLERHVGAEGGAADDRLLHARVVQERDRLAPEDGRPVVPHLGRPVGVPVTEQVEAQHAVAALFELLGERPVHLA
jgi:hypothetical protein